MKSLSKGIARSTIRWCLALTLVVNTSVWLASDSAAQEDEGQNLGDLETQETASMRESTYKELAKAQDAAEAERYGEATQVLDKLSKTELNNYERSQLLNLYAYVYYAQDNIPRAITTYEQLLQQPELPEALETSTTYTLSQLYFMQEDWQRSIAMLERWMQLTDKENKTAYEMMAQAYYQLGQYDKALTPAWKVVELTQAAGEPVKEQSYLLLRVLNYELKRYPQVVDILEELIRLYPKKQYWIQLASMYGEMDDQRKQLNVLELAYLQGYLTSETELLTLTSLMLNNELYFRAAKILEKGLGDGVISSDLEHWRLLAQAWTMAQENEKAIPALKRAVALSTDGRLDLILAQTYMNLERWEDAVQAARQALQKGSLTRPDQAQIMIGQALFELERFDEARTAFQAAQSDRRSRQLAAQWLNYIDSEEDRRAQLESALESPQ
jgi:tetratricopeptide (TPR) repeat protein